MSVAAAADLCRMLDQHAIRFWVVGGWGIDALLGRVTRPHKDLDVLLVRSQHEAAWRLPHEGYELPAEHSADVELLRELAGQARQR